MSENLKTLVFVVVAAAALGVAWTARPKMPTPATDNDAGQSFYDRFDPLTARSLAITTFDMDSGAPRSFQVAQKSGVWSLPSNEDYPADAEKHLAEAAGSLVDVTKGTIVSDSPGDHELYGVIDPTTAKAGMTGVGTRVRLADENNKTLAEFIVGKAVKDSPGQRFVRVPGRDRVYGSKITIDKLSTKFGDWIEKDLLKIDVNDINQVIVNPYSIDELNQRLIQGELLRLVRDEKDQKWNVDGLKEGEAPATERIEEMRRSLADLKIVDVHRKPTGLGRELRAVDQLRLDEAAVQSLAERGYYVVDKQLLSNEGEMIVTLKTGIQYVLRFGEVETSDRTVAGIDETASPSDASKSRLNRCLFLMAQFNEGSIPQPKLDVLPEESTPPTTDDPEMDKQIAVLIADARKRMEDSNKKKQDDYVKAIEDGRKKTQELNDRFADWYYVISDEVYRKIRLARSDAVKAPPPAEGTGVPPAPTEGAGVPPAADSGAGGASEPPSS